MSDMPWSKFFWSDWESDQGLRLCSLAAQGLWMRMLCVCAKHEPKGYLSINGNPLKVDAIARLAGVTETEAEILMAELELNGVFSRNRAGCIYSRRMVKDEKRSKEGRKHKNRGLKEAAEKYKENPAPSRAALRGASPQKPEARSQNIDDDDDDDRRAVEREPDGIMARACAAAGAEFGSLTGSGGRFGMAPKEVDALRRWQQDLGLTPAQIIASITDQASRLRSPPRSLTYFTPGLQQLAAELTAPPLQPAPHEVNHDRQPARDRRSAAADEALARRIAAAARID